jgi:tetratricopeptide (TPR) repeat protein
MTTMNKKFLVLALMALAGPALAEPKDEDPALQAALDHQDYKAAETPVRRLLAKPVSNEREREQIYQWLFAHDDSAEVDRRSRKGKTSADALAAGRLALDQHDFARAERLDRESLQRADTPLRKARALRALGQVSYQRRDFDTSLRQLQESLALVRTADALEALNETLIRLGRTDDAIAAAEEAVKLNPYHELAHYQLGNGYSRRNYTQMAAQEGDRLNGALVQVRNASDAFERGEFDSARDACFEALKLIPDLGRAHAILARTLEAQRFVVDVHRADYERRFAAAPMPQIPAIERYVLNWKDLTPRHQKRVALSLAPWKAYIPVLAEGGATLFIKPMYMKLSDAPFMQALKDQRIEYDSRLWDDVRGAGGYNTVTGIEDVERTIFDRYNTVLHELSHQVQSVLPADEDRKITALYQRAKSRDKPERMSFLSRYAGGSVFEYFAEGANSADSPRRDLYDPREIVRERLVELDPDLLALVEKMFAQKDVSASLPVALAGGAAQHLEHGDAPGAVAAYQRALKLAPSDERVQTGLLFALSVAADARGVNELAAQAVAAHPESGRVLTAAAAAQWHTGTPLSKVVEALIQARNRLKGEDRFLVDLAIADGLRNQGLAARALSAYEAALSYQADSPEALWGKAATLALADRWDAAFQQYEQVLRLRTGLVPLRADRLRDTLRAGRVEQAQAQLKEALLLDPTDPTLLALGAWTALAAKDAPGALKQAEAVLAKTPWCDQALIVKAAALRGLGRGDEAAAAIAPLLVRQAAGTGPSYVYRPEQSAWVSVHELPVAEQAPLHPTVGR